MLLYLSATAEEGRAWRFLTAVLVCMLVAVALLIVVPADGSFAGCGLRPPGLPYHEAACRYGAIIRGLMSGKITHIDDAMYVGLGSFPSFHVAGAVLCVWAVWHGRLARSFLIFLNILLVIGAIVIGGIILSTSWPERGSHRRRLSW